MRALALLLIASGLQAQEPLRFSDGRWELSGTAVVETFDGRETLRMETGAAVRRDVRMMDGTIDVDVMVTRRRSFVYVSFRMEDDDNHEEFYLRPHKSQLPDAVQYAPVFRGQSAWQLYHGARGTAAPAIEPDTWKRLRIVLSGRHAAFFLGDTTRPVMLIERMAREPREGYLMLNAFLPAGTPGSGPIARYANLVVRPGHVPFAFPDTWPVLPDSGIIREWSVGGALLAPGTSFTTIPQRSASRTHVSVEPNGMVELNRWLAMPPDLATAPGRPDVAVVARVRITAQSATVRRLDLGFSDAATVFLDGRPLFHGDDSYDFANRRDGLIGFDQASIYLPLHAGSNELAVVVTDHFGGWGLMGRIIDQRGLRIEPW